MAIDRIKDVKLHGWGKLAHKAIMLLTYPVRHIFKFLAFTFVILVILAAIPMMQGVSYQHIMDWYLLRYRQVQVQMPQETVSEPTAEAKVQTEHQFKEVAAPKIIRKRPVSETELTNGQMRRPFKRAEAPFRRIEVKEAAPLVKQPEEKKQSAQAGAEKQADMSKPKSYYRIDPTLPLVYEENPAAISGRAIIFSPNELTVGDTYLYLYGIYTDPEKYNSEKAIRYLEELTAGKDLNCRLVAYTYQNIATGVCFVAGRSLNQNLVDAGFAENVAL